MKRSITIVSLLTFAFAAMGYAVDRIPVVPAMTSQVKQVTKPAKAPPYQNYWDANAWDPNGGSDFWHSAERKPIRQDRVSKKRPVLRLFQKQRKAGN